MQAMGGVLLISTNKTNGTHGSLVCRKFVSGGKKTIILRNLSDLSPRAEQSGLPARRGIASGWKSTSLRNDSFFMKKSAPSAVDALAMTYSSVERE